MTEVPTFGELVPRAMGPQLSCRVSAKQLRRGSLACSPHKFQQLNQRKA